MRQVDFTRDAAQDGPQGPAFGLSLSQALNGYLVSAALFAAVELGLFDQLADGPLSTDELARRVDVDPSHLHRLVRVLVGLDLLCGGGDERLTLTPTARAQLLDGAADSIVPAVRHHHRHAYGALGQLAEAMRVGGPSCQDDGSDLYAMLDRRHETDTFIDAMNGFSQQVGQRITQLVDLSDAGTILDLGGGGGRIAHELLTALPDARVILADREPVLEIARERFGGQHPERLHTRAHDFQSDTLPAGMADVVLLSAVLGDWDLAWRRAILRDAWAATRPGGKLLISETILDDDERGPAGALLLNLYVLSLTQGGDNFTEAQWRAFLRDEGVERLEVVRDAANGSRDLIVCHKPAA